MFRCDENKATSPIEASKRFQMSRRGVDDESRVPSSKNSMRGCRQDSGQDDARDGSCLSLCVERATSYPIGHPRNIPSC